MHSVATITRQFEIEGAVLIESVLGNDEILRAVEAVDWAMVLPPAPYKWIRQRTYEWFETHPIFIDLIEHPLVIQLADAFFEGDDGYHLIAAQCSRNTKDDPYAPGAMKIHQDRVFFPQEERANPDVLTHRYGFSAMWYLQDTPLEMGPTEWIPRSHTGTDAFTDDALAPSLLRRQSIPAGSLLLFNHRTWHRGALNATARPRDLITNAYARPEIGKVQLTTPVNGKNARYHPCDPLLHGIHSSSTLRRLLRPV
jgi:hypothetical protein